MRYLLVLLAITASAQTVDWHNQIKNKPTTEAYEYIWSRTNNVGASGDLSSTGAGRTITLTPCPKGVNGVDTNHHVYISGGTGTAETALITGGSCTSGASTGTITVTTVNTHTGSWTVATATAGIQEAINVSPAGGGLIQIATGTHTLHGTITLPHSYIHVSGVSVGSTALTTTYTAGPVFSIPSALAANAITDLNITGPGSGSFYGIDAVDQAYLHVERVNMSNVPNGIKLTGNTFSQLSIFKDLFFNNITGVGAYIDTTIDAGTWENVVIAGGGASSIGWHVKNTVGMRMLNTYGIYLQTGMWIQPNAGVSAGVIDMTNAYFDGYASGYTSQYGLRISPVATATVNTVVMHGGAMSGSEYGILFDGAGTIDDVVFSGTFVTANSTAGAKLNYGTRISFTDCRFEGNGNSVNSGLWMVGGTDIRVRGGVYAAGSFGAGSNTQTYGIYAANTTNVTISDLLATPNITGSIFDGGGNTNLQIRDVRGYNPRGASVLTPSASPWTYTAGPTREVLYMFGGTFTTIVKDGMGLAAGIPILLDPGQSVVLTYTVAPATAYADRF